MQRPIIKVLFCMLMLSTAFATLIVAQSRMSAEQLVRDVAAQLITVLQEHQGQWDKHQMKLEATVERIVMPHVDFDYMARKVVGRHHWSKADERTQANFQRAFKTAVIRTYSQIFSQYHGEEIKVYPLPQLGSRKDRVQVSMSISRRFESSPVMVKYYFLRKGSAWLIYDFHVEDVGVLASYHAQYIGTLQRAGLEVLTQQIDRNNKQDRNTGQ